MKQKRDKYRGRLFLAFIMTNIIFIFIFLFSFSISYLNYQNINSQNNLIDEYLQDLSEDILKLNCENKFLLESSEKLDNVGARLSLLETRFGKKDSRVIEQKELYVRLEIKHFEIIKKIQNICGKNFTTILFFYSNDEVYEKESEIIGFILGTFKNKDPEKIMVYSFDYSSESEPVKLLKEKYGIKNIPIVIVNERDMIFIDSIDDLDYYN